MSNLGWYQKFATASKKVGGPLALAGIIYAGGAATYAGGSAIVKKVVKSHKKKKKNREAAVLYSVSKEGMSNEGLTFCIGDQFRVLEVDGDAALIEIIGNNNNPYFVSAAFLSTISSYKEKNNQR